jgi:hypothetical protein
VLVDLLVVGDGDAVLRVAAGIVVIVARIGTRGERAAVLTVG